jgi:hypothetical protein
MAIHPQRTDSVLALTGLALVWLMTVVRVSGTRQEYPFASRRGSAGGRQGAGWASRSCRRCAMIAHRASSGLQSRHSNAKEKRQNRVLNRERGKGTLCPRERYSWNAGTVLFARGNGTPARGGGTPKNAGTVPFYHAGKVPLSLVVFISYINPIISALCAPPRRHPERRPDDGKAASRPRGLRRHHSRPPGATSKAPRIQGGVFGANPSSHRKPWLVSHPTPSASGSKARGMPAASGFDAGAPADAVAPDRLGRTDTSDRRLMGQRNGPSPRFCGPQPEGLPWGGQDAASPGPPRG